ncbi:MAG: sugar phosphate isomerase/epimerase [Planctomycetota bacterium]|nr:sugar phosphate isomerase/epimerase [Planctomycetota bacterium]MDA1248746.1 sugar phosphate isomerase/epimerase [Planctomycetota bacterium]
MIPRTAFSTLSCPDWSFQDLIRNGTAFGFDGVEIRLLQRETDLLSLPDFQPSQLKDRRRELADAGFQICGLSSSVQLQSPDKFERQHQIETGRRYLELAVELGAGFVRVFGDVLQPTEHGSVPVEDVSPEQRSRTVSLVAEGLNQLGELAERQAIEVLIETHGDFSNTVVMEETMRQVSSPAAGVLWDTHHPWRFFDEELSASFQRLRPWIRHTHWKDSVRRRPASQGEESPADDAEAAATKAHDLMSGHRHADYVLFRSGEFPAQECMRLLKEDGYSGWHCLEWEKMWHPEIESPELALPLFPPKIRELWKAAGPLATGRANARLREGKAPADYTDGFGGK